MPSTFDNAAYLVLQSDYDAQYEPGPEGSIKDLRAMLERIGTLNYSEIDFRCAVLRDDEVSTPMREATRHSRGFRNFVRLLRDLQIDLGAFAVAEAPLLDDGWTAEAVHVLLEDDYECPDTRAEEIECKYCDRCATHLHSFHEPLWKQRKERIKAGLHPDGPFSEEELKTQAEWRKYVQIFYEEHMCYFCFKEYAEDAATGFDSHPGLIEVDV